MIDLSPLTADELAAGGAVSHRDVSAESIVLPVPDGTPDPAFSHPAHGEASAKWRYRDAEGRTLGFVVRFDYLGERKQVLPLTRWRDASGVARWRWKSWPAWRPILNLMGLAKRPDAPVLIVEGEKAAEAALRLFPGHVPTTSPGGSSAAAKADWRPLAGRHVVVCPDADEPGARYASDVARELAKVGAASVRVVDVSDFPEAWDVADDPPEGVDLAARLAAAKPVAMPAKVEWPSGFEMRSGGLFRLSGDAEKSDEWIAGAFDVEGEARDTASGGWSLALAWYDPDGVRHTALMPRADLIGDGVDAFRALAARGLGVPVVASKLRALKAALAGVRCDARVRLVSRTGWHGDAFALPDRTFGEAGERVVYQGAASAARYATKGDLSDWRETVAAPASGNSRLVLALSVAFAGPIADLVEDEPGGFHFVGNSSTGKSTALFVAGSVWGGGGRAGFVQTWRATGNGLEGVAKAHSGALLALDELGELDAREAGAVAYSLVNGMGKSRAARDGEARPRAEWRAMILSSGEIRLSDKIEEAGRRAKQGQVVRFVDIPADAGAGMGLFERCHGKAPATFAADLKAAALANYGTAGEALLSELAANVAALRREVPGRIRAIAASLAPADADGQVSRVARRFALVAVAGEIARAALALPWRDGEAEAAAATCFNAWLTARGGAGGGEVAAAVDAIREAIERHGDARFVRLDESEKLHPAAVVHNALGYKFVHNGEAVFGFTGTGWREVLRGVCDPVLAARELYGRGYLAGASAERLQVKKRVASDIKRLYAVRSAIAGGGDE